MSFPDSSHTAVMVTEEYKSLSKDIGGYPNSKGKEMFEKLIQKQTRYYAKSSQGWRHNTKNSIFVTVHGTWLGFAPVKKKQSLLGAHNVF